jgi:hypothetical protein
MPTTAVKMACVSEKYLAAVVGMLLGQFGNQHAHGHHGRCYFKNIGCPLAPMITEGMAPYAVNPFEIEKNIITTDDTDGYG